MLRKFPSKGETSNKVADDAAPAQLITLIFFTNWCYTKMTR